MRYLAALLLAPALCLAQTIDQKTMSLRGPVYTGFIWTAKVQMETLSATGTPLLTGTALNPPFDLSSDYLLVKLVGNKTVGTTISSLRLTLSPMAVPDWVRTTFPPVIIRESFATPVALPAGAFLGCRYFMPLQKLDFSKIALAGSITAQDTTGWLRCAVNVEPAAIPAEPATVVGTVLPPVPPAPVPTPPPPAPTPTACQESVQDAFVSPICDSLGASWTLVNGRILRDGTDMNFTINNQPATALSFIYHNHLVCGLSGAYYCWRGTAWTPY